MAWTSSGVNWQLEILTECPSIVIVQRSTTCRSRAKCATTPTSSPINSNENQDWYRCHCQCNPHWGCEDGSEQGASWSISLRFVVVDGLCSVPIYAAVWEAVNVVTHVWYVISGQSQ